MASVPFSSHHAVLCMNEFDEGFINQSQNSLANLKTTSPTIGLKYFNLRVIQRLHRYRFMKKQWQEVATSVRKSIYSSAACESSASFLDLPTTTQDTTKGLPVTTKKPNIDSDSNRDNDNNNAPTTMIKVSDEKNSSKFDPLHSRIQCDLIELRKIVKTKRGKFHDYKSFIEFTQNKQLQPLPSLNVPFSESDNSIALNNKKSLSVNQLNVLDKVKVSGCKMNHSTLSKNDSTENGISGTSNSLNTFSPYLKQQQSTKRDKTNRSSGVSGNRLNPLPHNDIPVNHESAESNGKKSSSVSGKTQSISSKQDSLPPPSSSTFRLPALVTHKELGLIANQTPLPGIQPLSDDEDMPKETYAYAAPSSSAAPRSMLLKRSAPLMPILLHSSPCVGIQTQRIVPSKSEDSSKKDSTSDRNDNFDHSIDQNEDIEDEDNSDGVEENDENNSYYYVLDYTNLMHSLPEPLINIPLGNGQDEFGILFEQLDRIRETMPDSNVYDAFVRTV